MGEMRWLYALALASGCGFEHGMPVAQSGGDDTPVIDAPQGSGDPGAEPTACTPGFVDLCGQAPPTMSLDVQTSATINTDTDPRCRTVTQTNGGPICLVYATSVSIGAGATLSATGSRPLAIASTSTMTISGNIDVASRRSDNKIGPGADGTCAFSATPEIDSGGAGGGAGASFGAVAGNGGRGDSDTSLGADGDAAPGLAGPVLTPTALRGGCRGQTGADESGAGNDGGAGGHSGGALYLTATGSLSIAGQVRASGAGGTGGQAQAGGGGGGSGGMVVVEAPTIAIAGTIAANGGGGGEGGARVANGGGGGSTDITGQPGADGGTTTTPAAGGTGNDTRFGFGGNGGAGSTAATAGTTSIVAGGGGGGAVGIIKLIGAATVTGTVTPSAS
jgi:hypothetical protein